MGFWTTTLLPGGPDPAGGQGPVLLQPSSGAGGFGPNPQWGHEPVTGIGNQNPPIFPGGGPDWGSGFGHEPVAGLPAGGFGGSSQPSPLLLPGGSAPLPNFNFTGAGAGPNPEWGRLFGNAPLWGGQQGNPGGGGLDHNSLAAMINQLLGNAGGIDQLLGGKLFGGSGGAWGGSGGGAWG